MYKMSESFVDAFPTLFLPMDLPNCPLLESDGRDENQSILNCLMEFLKTDQFHERTISAVLKTLCDQFIALHRNEDAEMHPPPFAIKESLMSTPIGGYWGLWIREQNATLLVQRLDNTNALILLWELQCPNSVVTDNLRAPQQTIPLCGMKVSWERLIGSSELLADLVWNAQEKAIPQSRKGGNEYDETRDVHAPLYALELLPCALGGDGLVQQADSHLVGSSPGTQVPLITKKMRDEVRYQSSKLPWRRAPVWAAIKSMLHLVNVHETGDDQQYKMFVQTFLSFVLKKVASHKVARPYVTLSSLTEASRKLVRRLDKLQGEARDTCFKATEGATRAAMDVVQQGENEDVRGDPKSYKIPLHNFVRDTAQKMPGSRAALQQLVEIAEKNNGEIASGSRPEYILGSRALFPRLRQWSALNAGEVRKQTNLLRDSLSPFSKFAASPHDFVGTFHDISEGIMEAFETISQGRASVPVDKDSLSIALLGLLHELIDVCSLKEQDNVGPFEGDVGGKSQAILIGFTICLLLDQVACAAYPLLRKHSLGIGLSLNLDTLFLATVKHKKHLEKVEAYLREREEAGGPCILNNKVSRESFSVKFAARDNDMQRVLNEIEAQCAQNQANKRKESSEAKQRYNSLMGYVAIHNCTCTYHSNRYQNWKEECTRCEKEKEARNIEIYYYEKLLPPDPSMQRAVVFYLRQPVTLSCHQDSFVMFAAWVCDEQLFREEDWSGHWKIQLPQWASARCGMLHLGSTRKKITQSHYGSSSAHVTKSTDFIVDNGYNTVLMDDKGYSLVNIEGWKWNIMHHTTMIVEEGPYKTLECFYNSFDHSENDVIADKSQASEQLSLREFEAVGTLRAGSAFQLVRLVHGIAQRNFSLDREDIVSLLRCVLWQAGPRTNETDWLRKSFQVLKTRGIAAEICQQLQEVLCSCRENWGNQNSLLSVLCIARALLDHFAAENNAEASQACANIMLECRNIAYDWIQRLMKTSNGCTNDQEMQFFQIRMADIAVIGTLSFSAHHSVFSTAEHVAYWVYFRAVFQDNSSPNQFAHASWRRRNWLRATLLSEELALVLDGYTDRKRRNGLDIFLKMYWTKAANGTIEKRWSSAHFGWFHATVRLGGSDGGRSCLIEVDTCGGTFLVNGSPCSRLPKEITVHIVYRRFFGDALFLVEPQGTGGFCTRMDVEGFQYEFYPPGYTSSLDFQGAPFILKTRGSQKAILLPQEILQDDVPELLLSEHSHWFLLTSDLRCQLHFRQPSYTNPRISDSFSRDKYILCCAMPMWTLRVTSSGADLLCIHSYTFMRLHVLVLQRLSPEAYIHILVWSRRPGTEGMKHRVTIQFPRLHNLQFDYDGIGIVSREFGSLRVATNQSLGTLYGLQHGILLESPCHMENKLFICPHGKVSRYDSNTSIDTDNLKSPPFFTYELRPELGDLHGKSQLRREWLFLALLHAQTGRLQHDPFLGCTGSEKALSLLRSPHCTGDLLTSLDKDDVAEQFKTDILLLVDIAKISPMRENYHGMEKCHVLDSRPALCAHPALAFLAQLRIHEVQKALELIGYALPVDVRSLQGRTCQLGSRSYFFRREFYPKAECLSSSEEMDIFERTEVTVPASFDPTYNQFGRMSLDVARYLGINCQGPVARVNEKVSIQTLLCDREDLIGFRNEYVKVSGFPSVCFNAIAEGIARDRPGEELELADSWMTLYRIAKATEGNQGYADYCTLLVWFGIHFPHYRNHLCQLMIVARHPTEFPSSLSYRRYELPNESEYDKAKILAAIETNLKAFSPRRPHLCERATDAECRRHETRVSAWEQEKKRHERNAHDTKLRIEQSIDRIYRCGGDDMSECIRTPMVSSPCELTEVIRNLFERWRQARKLKEFATRVTEAIYKLEQNGALCCEKNAPGFCLVSTSVVSPIEFRLKTNSEWPNLVRSTKAGDFKEIAGTGKFPGVYRFQCPRAPTDCTRLPPPMDFPGAFVAEHPESEQLFRKILAELDISLEQSNNFVSISLDEFTNPAKIGEIKKNLQLYREKAATMMAKSWKLIEYELSDLSLKKSLKKSLKESVGLWDAVTPLTVLKTFFHPSHDVQNGNCKNDAITFSDLCLAFAVCVKHAQRARRCLRLLQHGSAKFPRLARDLESPGCDGWTPKDYPEFLGFEIDNNLTIRAVQARVALEILTTNHGNRLLQLNMGEGKTAVIMPLVLCTAARGRNIVRATVLPSLFSTNAADWQHKLGGILGRRIYTFCCRRDLKFGVAQGRLLLEKLDMIKKGRHVMVTTPENRLSLENKAVELCSKSSLHSNAAVGNLLLQVMDHLSNNGREFLDESDEILSPLYQLIYTLGPAQDMDGGVLRWKMHAAVLQSVQLHADEMLEGFGPETVEISNEDGGDSKNGWLSLLENEKSNHAYMFLIDKIIDDILQSKVPRGAPLNLQMNRDEKEIWISCIRRGGGGGGERLDELTSLGEKEFQSALILRGLLSDGVLKSILLKRYRVNYGKHPTRQGYQMAVPFRAKDVAAERTEFGHPDMALGLTYASYYQSGLGESELRRVFHKLSQMSESVAKAIYSEWASDLEDNEGIAEYEGFNSQDPVLFRERIIPAFCRNIGCIDFYLTVLIFPVQAKQFPLKILANAGDMCRNKKLGPRIRSVTTGFSGTTSSVLPITVKQENLRELEATNGLQLRAILRPGNNHYLALKSESMSQNSTGQLLALLGGAERRSDVVLDSGALVLHKNNVEFSQAWLRIRPDKDACVFFIADRVYYVTHNSEHKHAYRGSPYVDDMSKCLLYLDDEHTRGSDFELPLNARAVVTLGKGITKEKFVQTSLRMRQLASSQSL
mgnify:CR=1 FL=1